MDDIVGYVQAAKYLSAGLIVAFCTVGAATAQGKIAAAACENVGKYAESAGRISRVMLFGLAFPETIVIFALVFAFAILKS